ncbi:hypothetical protein [Chryseobacterium sp. RR2-3-20]|uniref:hypothetical protein n=1 Tax=Chryseobacterium sp. RR2-3-20 TaxID=2787626 RepID=UPI001ADED141|nr:hypothetical protein [Chryseobacterium sp. RR2-3-20]
MEKNEILEVQNYLKKRIVSRIILIEVYDHFIMQISDLMKNGIGFQQAFTQVKIKWEHELEMVPLSLFSFKKISRIEKKSLGSKYRKITTNSILITLLAAILNYINPDFLVVMVMILAGLCFLVLLYNFLFKKMSIKEYMQLSYHPLIVRNMLLGVLVFSIVYFVSKNRFFWEVSYNQIFLVFAVCVQVQLLFMRTQKLNIAIV